MLTLTRQSAPAAQLPSLIPACLQPRAPHSYELFDEAGNRLQPTLSGYNLKPDHSYYLKVRAQDGNTANWKLRLLAPRSQIDARNEDYVEGETRVIQFHVVSRPVWQQLTTRISMLPVHLEDSSGRELYRFEIPIVLTMHWSMWLGSLIGVVCTPLSFLLSDSDTVMKTVGLLGLTCLAFIGLSAWDLYRAYRRGQQVLRKNAELATRTT